MDIYSYIRKCFIWAILFSILTGELFASKGKYPIQNFTPADYKAGIQNIDFAQNRDMTIFVANNLGVLAYDGNDWKTNVFKKGKKERSLAFDEENKRLYVGSQGEFGFFEQNWEYTSLLEKIPAASRDFDEVWDVFLFNSEVYFCTFQAIYIYDGASIVVLEQEGGFNRSFLNSGKLFTQNQAGQLFEVKDQKLVSLEMNKQSKRIVAGVLAQEEGNLIFYNSGEIELITPFGIKTKYEQLSEVLKDTYVNHILPLSDARLVISTQTSGVFLYDLQQGIIENISIEDGLQSNACLRTFQDFSGSLWVGMQNGIALIDINSPMRFINQDIQLQGSGYEAYETEEGTYYTTSNGIYFLGNNAQRSLFLAETEGPAYGMQKIMGKLYAGHHTGLFLLENGRARRIAITNGLWQVKALRSNPQYAIGGTYSGLSLFRVDEQLELQVVKKIKGFDESSRFFEEDNLGRIWVGQYYKGLYQLTLDESFTEATVKKVMEDYDLPIDEQILLSRIDNELYIATKLGLYKLDEASDRIVEATTFEEVIGKQPIYFLMQDHKKNIHIFAENLVGFFKQISANNYVYIPSSLYQMRYFFNNDLLNVSVNVKNGILFNANDGFIYYRPELENRMKVDLPLIIKSVSSITEDSILYARPLFDQIKTSTPTLKLAPKSKILHFEVESFQFNKVNNQIFRYYLKGLEDDFGEWTTASVKEYTNLKEGEYEFVAQTRSHLGEIISSSPFLLQVKPPFYRSIWAKIGYVLLGILALVFVSTRQKYRYKQKASEIEAARQQELQKEQQKLLIIEQQKEQELAQLKTEKMLGELQLVKKQLAASTMNLVVKNEFIETIKEELNTVKQKGKSVDMRKSLERIVKGIDSTLRLQEDWEQFEYHFEQVHGDFLSRLTHQFQELSPNEQKLCAFLRLNLNTKDIANLMGISLRGVEVARYRLRKKLDLEKGQNLAKFILEY